MLFSLVKVCFRAKARLIFLVLYNKYNKCFSRSKRPELIILRSHHLHVSFTLDIKRLIGRRFDEACVDSDVEKWPFQVINGWELFCQLLDH